MFVCTGKAYSPASQDWTVEASFVARNRQEAINWVRFQRDWMKDLRVDGVPA